MVQQAILKIDGVVFEQALLLPIRRAPIDPHQPAGFEADLLEPGLRDFQQAKVALFKGAIFEAEAAEGGFNEATVLKMAAEKFSAYVLNDLTAEIQVFELPIRQVLF